MNGLKYIRQAHKMTLAELASILEVTRQVVSMWENNHSPIPYKRRKELATIFGVTQAHLGMITADQMREIDIKAGLYLAAHKKLQREKKELMEEIDSVAKHDGQEFTLMGYQLKATHCVQCCRELASMARAV